MIIHQKAMAERWSGFNLLQHTFYRPEVKGPHITVESFSVAVTYEVDSNRSVFAPLS